MPRAVILALVTMAATGNLLAAAGPVDEAPPATPTSIKTVAPDAAEPVLGSAIVDKSGKEIGHLVDVLVDRDGAPQAGVIDFGGFLGVGARKVAVHWGTLHFAPGDGKHQIVLEMTPDEIRAAPAYTDPDKPASVVTPATPLAGNVDNPAPAEPSPH